MLWEGSDSEFTDNWDDATGLGKANTKWVKWCIAGTNGTSIVDGKVHIGINVTTSPDYTTLGDSVGSNSVTIAKANLPAEGLHILTGDVAGNGIPIPGADDSLARARAQSPANALNYEMVRGNSSATLGRTSNLGSGVALDITPNGIISLFIIKLVD